MDRQHQPQVNETAWGLFQGPSTLSLVLLQPSEFKGRPHPKNIKSQMKE